MPSLFVETSPSIIRVLNIRPYNQFILTCTARAQVNGENVPIQMTIKWIRRVELQKDSGRDIQFFDVPTENYKVIGSPSNDYGYRSILTTNETSTEGKTSYRCSASIVRNANEFKRKFRDSQIAVAGMLYNLLQLNEE